MNEERSQVWSNFGKGGRGGREEDEEEGWNEVTPVECRSNLIQLIFCAKINAAWKFHFALSEVLPRFRGALK